PWTKPPSRSNAERWRISSSPAMSRWATSAFPEEVGRMDPLLHRRVPARGRDEHAAEPLHLAELLHLGAVRVDIDLDRQDPIDLLVLRERDDLGGSRVLERVGHELDQRIACEVLRRWRGREVALGHAEVEARLGLPERRGVPHAEREDRDVLVL